MTDNPRKVSLMTRMHIDFPLLVLLLILLVYSAFVLWSASGLDPEMMERRLGQIFSGIIIMLVLAQIPPRVYETWAPHLYIVCVILLVFVDVFGQISKGAQRWLDLGIVRFQPSEIAKIAVPLMVARFMNRDQCPPTLKNTAIALLLVVVPTLLVAAQPDLGTSILVAASGIFVLFLAGMSWRLIGIALLLLAAFIPLLWFFLMHDYQRGRVMMLLDPETDPLGAGYHIIQSKIAIGSGGLKGLGLGNSVEKQLWLPESTNDFIFSVVCEELGFIGAVLIIVLFILLIAQGLMIAYKAENQFCTMVGIGIMAQIAWQVFCNIAVVTNTIPNTGISLPFFSSGGTSLILLLAEMGVMVNIGRNGERAAQQRAAAHAQRQAAKAQRDAELKDRTINLDDARRARNEL